MIVFASALSAPPPPPECPSVFERAAEAASTALLVASGAFGCSHVDDAHLRLSRLSQRVEIFQLRKKRWPTELSEVFGDEGVPLTPWGHAYVLAPALVVGGAPTLVDPGRDGVLAQGCGRREDADLRWGWTTADGYGPAVDGPPSPTALHIDR